MSDQIVFVPQMIHIVKTLQVILCIAFKNIETPCKGKKKLPS